MIASQNKDHSVTLKYKYPLPSSHSVMSSLQKLISCLGHMLTKLIQQAPSTSFKTSKFYCKTKPAISVSDYLKRISRYASCTQYVFLKALIYIDRFQNSKQDFSLNQFSIHRQLMCAVMIATKYSEDFYYTNKHYSKVGGIPEDDMNKMQKQFLETIDFALYVKPEQLAQYEEKLNTYYEITMGFQLQGSADSQTSPVRTQGILTNR